MSFGPTGYRFGGTRGGADRFSWDDVKTDKYRENYLGHSLAAPVGRWQKGKDLTWYNKAKNNDGQTNSEMDRLQAEREALKRAEEDMMNEALGLAPKRQRMSGVTLDPNEVKELLKRGTTERDRMDVERVEGLGAAPAPIVAEHIPRKSKIELAKEALARGEDPFSPKNSENLNGPAQLRMEGGSGQRPTASSSEDSSNSDSDDAKPGKKSKSSRKRKKEEKKRKKHKEKKKEKKRKSKRDGSLSDKERYERHEQLGTTRHGRHDSAQNRDRRRYTERRESSIHRRRRSASRSPARKDSGRRRYDSDRSRSRSRTRHSSRNDGR